jgi:hypothetical protein
MTQKAFVHVLLFECSQCGSPIDSAITSSCSNPEEIDGKEIHLRCCNCGWTGDSHGFAAKRRLIVAWDPRETQVRRYIGLPDSAARAIAKGHRSNAVGPEN